MRKVLFVTHDLLAGLPSSFLDRRGVRARTVADGVNARRTCAAWCPDVVVLPAHMVGISAELRAMTPNVLIVAVGDLADDVAVDAKISLQAPIETIVGELGSVLGVMLRRSPRVEIDAMARVRPGGGEQAILAHVVEISDSGLLLECETALTRGLQIAIEFRLPGESDPVAPRCIVVSGDEFKQRYGVAFAEMVPAHREAIIVYVELQIAARAELTRLTEDE